jgi:hypothetical protein
LCTLSLSPSLSLSLSPSLVHTSSQDKHKREADKARLTSNPKGAPGAKGAKKKRDASGGKGASDDDSSSADDADDDE